ncbi:hypothetical protein SAMN05216223_10577 [Actinacidiphila yanglinensis]|uniref:WXG100 family type VII secretion target n=1 Tax=Actinacidiphila yanglinensis TaxID=310779 RepID=A0A1H5ZZT6_9ACTN|nr:hypothetical protein [Actinacidiphila yanglinensis]SEG41989.1 hypothetical protein SAMN05216223_10577 [Actinacidiphila yanglinensis]
MSGRMVDNPRRAWLQSLLTSMDTTLETMRPALDRPASDFGGGTVWTGTAAADTFASDITGRSRSIHTLTDGLRTTVENALRAEPLQVTEDQARQMRREQQHDR